MEEPINSLPLAFTNPSTGPNVSAGVRMIIAGLALIALGGCCCIGIVSSLIVGTTASGPSSTALTSGQLSIIWIDVLYVEAIASFVFAPLLWVLGIRKFPPIGRS